MKFSARSLEITLDERGYIVSALAYGQEVLKKPSPIVTVLKDGCAYTPKACRAENGLIIVETEGGSAALRVSEEGACLTVCAEQVDSGIYGIGDELMTFTAAENCQVHMCLHFVQRHRLHI